ncbi:MAG: hypothetical protein M3259_06700 [Actinomycetota bacterium]|nr:hypothetical protein [Actinomycetota bacterium]
MSQQPNLGGGEHLENGPALIYGRELPLLLFCLLEGALAEYLLPLEVGFEVVALVWLIGRFPVRVVA